MIPFPSIEKFSHVRRSVQTKVQFRGLDEQGEPILDRTAILPKIKYSITTKIHGSNGSIVFNPDGSFYVQSRNCIITPENDNAGFAKFVYSLTEDQLAEIKYNFPVGYKVVVYGEWAGPGIQQNVAISQIKQRSFFIFAARMIVENDPEKEIWMDIRKWHIPSDFLNMYNIYRFFSQEIEIDFEHPEPQLAEINKLVESIEQKCPVGFYFGINGIGEGITLKPVDEEWNNSKFWVKCKGQEHSKSHVKKLATVNLEAFQNGQDFVAKVLDEERLQQGINWLKEQGKEISVKSTGDFLRFIVNDIIKETIPERAESGISDNDVGKLVNVEAKRWFFSKI